MINTLGSFAGILGPMTAGFMLTQSGGNWTLPFLAAAGVGVVCAAILFIVPIRPIVVEPFLPLGNTLREQPH
jgi:MFS family permease